MIEKVRELHRPVVTYADRQWAYCAGCDMAGYEAEDPEWPCRTAEIVYTEAEIADWRPFARILHEGDPPPPSPLSRTIASLYAPVLEAQLTDMGKLPGLEQ